MRIQNNVQAFNAFRNLSNSQNMLGKSLEKLSSGYRINRAADDAAGLVTSENLRAKIGGLQVASRNAQDGISVVQTAEGALTEVHSILGRMRDLAVQAANTGGTTDAAIDAAQAEVDELTEELNRIFTSTKYGDKTLFDDTAAQAFSFQVGADSGDQIALTVATAAVGGTNLLQRHTVTDAADFTSSAATIATGAGTLTLTQGAAVETFTYTATTTLADIASAINASDTFDAVVAPDGSDFNLRITSEAAGAAGTFSLGDTGASDFTTVTASAVDTTEFQLDGLAHEAIQKIDAAIEQVSTLRGDLGAFQNRMESTIRNLGVATENLTAAESRIRDADMALETVSFTKNQVLQQAGVAMLAQANVAPQSVLRLLG